MGKGIWDKYINFSFIKLQSCYLQKMDTTGGNHTEWVKLISESQISKIYSHLLFLDLIYIKMYVCMYACVTYIELEVKLSKRTNGIKR